MRVEPARGRRRRNEEWAEAVRRRANDFDREVVAEEGMLTPGGEDLLSLYILKGLLPLSVDVVEISIAWEEELHLFIGGQQN